MGVAGSWLAVKGNPPSVVLDALGLRGTGIFEEFAESPFAGASYPVAGIWLSVILVLATN